MINTFCDQTAMVRERNAHSGQWLQTMKSYWYMQHSNPGLLKYRFLDQPPSMFV